MIHYDKVLAFDELSCLLGGPWIGPPHIAIILGFRLLDRVNTHLQKL